ncbi:hypothetical protein MBLNU459_g3366t1 [Dothideomycetes sp. NU459]
MAASLQPLKEWKCTYAACFNSFASEEQMINHKKRDHEFYCKKCASDGVDWEDDLRHKINDMTDVIYRGRRLINNDGKVKRSFKHIVCEFCGEDFKSLGGRDLHKKQMHQADQNIRCHGHHIVYDPRTGRNVREECEAVFGRPSQFVNHIEAGYCRYITMQELERERQHKQIVKQIMMDPVRFTRNLHGSTNPEADDISSKASSASIMDFHNDNENGGIGLIMDSDNAEGPGRHPVLQPRSALTRASLVPDDQDMRSNGERSTYLSSKRQEVTSRSSSFGGSTTTPLGTSKYSEEYPSIGSATPSTTNSSRSDFTVNRWRHGQASAVLYPNAKPSAPEVSASAIAASYKRTQREDAKTNLFRSHFWDPTHPDYDCELFRHRNSNFYRCPFPECEQIEGFGVAVDISYHLRTEHAESKKQCRLCRKNFKTLTGLVSHYEASERGSKCKVSKSDGYEKFIDEATGGFLSATRVYEEEIWGAKDGRYPGDGLGDKEDKETPVGVRSYAYEGRLPNDVTRR